MEWQEISTEVPGIQGGAEVDPSSVQKRRGHQAPYRKGNPQGISEAGSQLSLEEQLDYHNNSTGVSRDDIYCTACSALLISKFSSIITLE